MYNVYSHISSQRIAELSEVVNELTPVLDVELSKLGYSRNKVQTDYVILDYLKVENHETLNIGLKLKDEKVELGSERLIIYVCRTFLESNQRKYRNGIFSHTRIGESTQSLLRIICEGIELMEGWTKDDMLHVVDTSE